ncbi:MAG: V-type ATPase subunit [Ruminococcus sp.]|nr:V-type ATPase subunit [Ruminococcus sp.]
MSTDYASAVAVVRTLENQLFNRHDFDQLINARDGKEFETLINSKNSGNLTEVWEMLRSFAPDSKELEIMLYRNDFHNLKAVLKAMISGREPDKYLTEPSTIKGNTLKEMFRTKNTDLLPAHMRDTAVKAYGILTTTLDGQLLDSFIDTECLKAMRKSAEKSGNNFIMKYVEQVTVCADIKTAYRCSKMGKDRNFLETAICGSDELDKEMLIRITLSGTENLLNFLDSTQYYELSGLLRENPAKFEKRCDDLITEQVQTAQFKAFGTEPLIAYYIAKETEIKNLRIIKVCRECGADMETITERLRETYV